MKPLKHRPNASRAGHSMIELLVSATILTIGIAATLVVNSAAGSLRRTASETRTATGVIGNLFESMRSLTPTEVADGYPEGTAVTTQEASLTSLSVAVDHNGYVASDSSIVLTLTATWTSFNGNQRTMSMDTVF